MKRLLLTFIFALLIVTKAAAQGSTVPIVLVIDGDYYVYDAGQADLRPLTELGGNNRLPALSPDGKTLAFTTVAPVAVEVLKRVGGVGGGGELPTDVHLLNLASGEETVIAAQPDGAAFLTDNGSDSYRVRGTPAWSPDSSQLAWAEYDEKGQEQSLVIYDRAAGTTESNLTVPFPLFSVPNPVSLMWGKSGFIVENILPYVNPETGAVDENIGATTYSVFPLRGQNLQVIQPPFTQNEFPFGASLALRPSDGQEYLMVAYNEGDWKLYNLSTGAEEFVPGNEMQITSALSPDTSQRLWVGMSMPVSINSITSSEREPIGGPIDASYYDLDQYFAVSPDGNAFVYMDYSADNPAPVTTAYIWQDGEITNISIPPDKTSILAVLWGPAEWQIDEAVGVDEEGSAALPQFECPGSQLPPRLTVGGQGRVTAGGGSNRMRALPGTDGAQVGTIPELGVFDVHDGPICTNGIVWWQVVYNGEIGWTAEGLETDYFVEPVE